jgi:hypothetical protein
MFGSAGNPQICEKSSNRPEILQSADESSNQPKILQSAENPPISRKSFNLLDILSSAGKFPTC